MFTLEKSSGDPDAVGCIFISGQAISLLGGDFQVLCIYKCKQRHLVSSSVQGSRRPRGDLSSAANPTALDLLPYSAKPFGTC